MKIFRFVKSKRLNKKINFETKIIRLISTLLVFLLLSVIFLYYSSIKSMYSEQLKRSNDSIIEQVAISFEMIMKQISEVIYQIPLYDTEMIRIIKSDKKDEFFIIELQRKLNSLVLSNSYLYSSYLYLPAQNIVYSSEIGNIFPLESFTDIEAIVLKSKGTISVLEPRFVDVHKGKKLLISIVCPIPLYQGEYQGLLVVNIDANKLYYDVLKKIKKDENMNFYVYNKDYNMVINKDASLLYSEFIPNESSKESNNYFVYLKNILSPHEIINSLYYSPELKWNFVLETSINSISTFRTKLYSIGISFIILLSLSLVIIICIVKFSTKPMKKALSGYSDKLLVDFLTDHNIDLGELEEQLSMERNQCLEDTFTCILIQVSKIDIAQNTFNHYLDCIKASVDKVKHSYVNNIVVINKNQIALLANFEQGTDQKTSEEKLSELSTIIYNNLDQDTKLLTHISISSFKESFRTLPISYKECIETFNYRLTSDSHILMYSRIKGMGQKLAFEYPYELEKQLINNLIVENLDSCKIFLEKFFNKLTDPLFCLSDSEIKIYVYQLQSSILKSLSSLPIPIKIDSNLNILNLYNFNDIKEKVLDLIIKTYSVLSKTEETKEFNLVKSIFEYIDNRYTNEGFNQNSVADELNLNRHYLGKMVKEKTGDTFSDYINKKRVLFAKYLLNDKKMSIEQIAHKVGFNYTHYFIKVFKVLEGITPGQYRDNIMETNISK